MLYNIEMTLISEAGGAMADSYYTTDKQIEEMREEIRRAKNKTKGDSNDNSHELGKTPRNKRKKNRFARIAGTVAFSLSVVILTTVLISVLIAKSRGEMPDILGFQLFVIESGSMEPTLNVGSVILTKKPEDTSGLKVGDVVTFKSLSGAVITHRIIGVVTAEEGGIGYQTKGDNPINSPDQDMLTPDRVITVMVMKIPLT